MKERLVEVFWVREGLEEDFLSVPNTIGGFCKHNATSNRNAKAESAEKT